MVEFTETDMKLAVGMVIFLIFVNFAFPPLGLAGPETERADIPDFNVTEGTFSFVQTVPDRPSAPSEGTLTYREDAGSSEGQTGDNRQIFLEGDSDNGVLISLVEFNGTENPEPEINLIKFNGSAESPFSENKRMDEGEFKVLENFSYTVEFSDLEIANVNRSDMTITVSFEVSERPSDTGFLSSIPVVGTIFSAGSAVAGAVAWIGSILYNLVLNFIIGSTNLALVTYNILSFFVGIGYWFLSTYNAVITNAPTAWASLVLAIPGFTLSLLFGKLIIIGKQLIPLLG